MFFNKKQAGFSGIFLIIVCLVILLGGSFYFLKGRGFLKKGAPVSEEKIPLPKTDQIGVYIQSQLVDLDKDGIKEMVAIYPEREDETNSYNTVFVIFKLKDNQWVKLIEQKLGNFLFTKDRGTLVEFGKIMSKFTLSDLTNDGYPDVLAEGKIEGSGGYLYAYIYGLKNGQLEQLWFAEQITKGKVGIEDNKVWLIMPSYYGPSDPSCCPSVWQKNWWQWEGNEFKEIQELKENNLEKLKNEKME